MSFDFNTNISIPNDVVESIAEFVKEELDISGSIETVLENMSRFDRGVGQAVYSFCEDAAQESVDSYIDNHDFEGSIDELNAKTRQIEEDLESKMDDMEGIVDALRGQIEILQEQMKTLIPKKDNLEQSADPNSFPLDIVAEPEQEIVEEKAEENYSIVSPDLSAVFTIVNLVKQDMENGVDRPYIEYWEKFINFRSFNNNKSGESE